MSNEASPSAEMPRYKCHKEVHALKIARIVDHRQAQDTDIEGGGILFFEDARFAQIAVEKDWMDRCNIGPDTGLGYYVVYADGYKSWSPTKAFEEGYTKIS